MPLRSDFMLISKLCYMVRNIADVLLEAPSPSQEELMLDYIDSLEEYVITNLSSNSDCIENGFTLSRDDGTKIGVGIVITYKEPTI